METSGAPTPPPFDGAFDPADRRVLEKLLEWRRDVRHFRTDPLPPGAVDVLRSAMDLAPSVGNARPWRVVQVETPALRAEIRADFACQNAAAAQQYRGKKAQQYAALKLAGLDAAPLQLAIFTALDPDEGHGLGRATIPATLQQSTAMAIFCLWLTARAQNWGVGMVSILDPAMIEEKLGQPGWQFSAYLCIGWPDTHDDTPLLARSGWQENQVTRWTLA